MKQITTRFLILFFALLAINIQACKEDVLPKPKAQLRLQYDDATYKGVENNCPYHIEVSQSANAKTNNKCWLNIEYPKLKASINLTYRPVKDNLKELFLEAEKLTFNHSIKADAISSIPFRNKEKRKFGAIFEVTGNAASPLQFHITDSTKHFITGAVYFNVTPNYDSIAPAIDYVRKDLIHLMESLEWK